VGSQRRTRSASTRASLPHALSTAAGYEALVPTADVPVVGALRARLDLGMVSVAELGRHCVEVDARG
jgi:hypothetical protein